MPGYEQWKRELIRRRTRFTVPELRQVLAVDYRTLDAWIARGLLTVSYGKRGFGLIRKAAVKRLLQNPDVAKTVAKAQAKKALRSG